MVERNYNSWNLGRLPVPYVDKGFCENGVLVLIFGRGCA
jgi:hypothetical protein